AAVVKKAPRFADAYHLLAEIQAKQGQRVAAAATLRAGLDAVPNDSVGLAQLVELLASPARPGAAPEPSALQAARDLARSAGDRDAAAHLALAAPRRFPDPHPLDTAP